jgi:putative DNA methylase
MKAIEKDFPFEQIDSLAEMESYRKEINRPIYHIHKWWAKRLGSVFRAITMGAVENDWKNFHDNIDSNKKVVLDPFMGSGTTVGEAIKLGCKAIGCDINPVSTFLVNQALTRVNLESLKKEFKAIEYDIADIIKSYYKTKIDGFDELCDVLYYFWVKTVTTEHGEVIPLFNTYIFSKNAYPSKKPNAKVVCPSCGNVFGCLYNSESEQCPSCKMNFNPQQGNVKGSKVKDTQGKEYKIKDLIKNSGTAPNHRLFAIMALTPNGEKVYLKPKAIDFELYESALTDLANIEKRLPLPIMFVRQGHNTDQARGYNYLQWRDFFNSRQLLCLGLLYERILAIEDKGIKEQFITLFSSTLEFNNMFCSFKGEGTGAVRHMFSNHILKPEKTPLENNIWGTSKSSGTFSTLFKSKLLKAKEYLDFPFELKIKEVNGKRTTEKIICSNSINVKICNEWGDFATNDVLLLNGDSGRLPIPDFSVDAVVTDPPYFDFIHYSELSDFFYAWLSVGLHNQYTYFQKGNSSDNNEVQDKNVNSFSTKIGKIFSECFRVLKEEGLMCFSYHHSTIDGWLAIYKAITIAKFDIVASHPVKAEMDVASPKTSTKNPINIDAILVCKKEEKQEITSDIIDDIIAKYEKYILRFESVGRNLSDADRFVILCSQTLVQASIRRLSVEETKITILKVIKHIDHLRNQEKARAYNIV